MTKKQILDKRNIYFGLQQDNSLDEIEEAMDEYAKQEAIDFSEWTVIKYKPVHIPEEGVFYWLDTKGMYTTEELYELYLQSKK